MKTLILSGLLLSSAALADESAAPAVLLSHSAWVRLFTCSRPASVFA